MTGTLILTGSTPLQITTTTPAAGKILTSDASGNASWGAPAGISVPLNLSGSQASSSILTVTNTASAPTIEALTVTSQTAGDRAVGVQVTGDANRRLAVDSNGVLNWGSGGAAPDTNLYRSGPSTLQTDDSLVVALNASATGGVQVGAAATAFGGGVGVLGLSNAGTVPNTNPASGLVVYSFQDSLRWRSSNGDVYSGNAAWRDDLVRPTVAIAETLPRWAVTGSNTPTSGLLNLTPIWLPKGAVISNLSWFNGGPAGATMTHQWAAIYNSARVQLAVTADKTTTAIPSFAAFTWAIAAIASGASTTYTATYTGLHYVGLMIAATTMPAPVGPGVSGFTNTAPAFGASDTAQTTTPAFPHTAAAPTSTSASYYYMYVS
jgi:hypothetical protein